MVQTDTISACAHIAECYFIRCKYNQKKRNGNKDWEKIRIFAKDKLCALLFLLGLRA